MNEFSSAILISLHQIFEVCIFIVHCLLIFRINFDYSISFKFHMFDFLGVDYTIHGVIDVDTCLSFK